MKNKLFLSQLFLVFIFFFSSGCVSSDSHKDDLLNKIQHSLNEGNVVVVYQMNNKDKSTEQYADWSAYLNDLHSKKLEKYRVYESSLVFNEILKRKKLKANKSYTVFMKKGLESYFYEGVIVEPMVYMAVENRYQGKKVTSMDRAFLPDVIKLDIK